MNYFFEKMLKSNTVKSVKLFGNDSNTTVNKTPKNISSCSNIRSVKLPLGKQASKVETTQEKEKRKPMLLVQTHAVQIL